jgi:hypothetical protein
LMSIKASRTGASPVATDVAFHESEVRCRLGIAMTSLVG